jgi:hypothetical protein
MEASLDYLQPIQIINLITRKNYFTPSQRIFLSPWHVATGYNPQKGFSLMEAIYEGTGH